MSLAIEQERNAVLSTLRQVEALEELKPELTGDQARRVGSVVHDMLRTMPPVRVPIASTLLGLTEQAVRSWAKHGVLVAADTAATPRLVLDPERLHEVMHLVQDLRDAGTRSQELRDAVWFHLEDSALHEREDLQESLVQLRNGDTVPAC